jgi:hypothetical protein
VRPSRSARYQPAALMAGQSKISGINPSIVIFDAALPVEPFSTQIEQQKTGYMAAKFTADSADLYTFYSVYAMRKNSFG